jgi:hypothetical protein
MGHVHFNMANFVIAELGFVASVDELGATVPSIPVVNQGMGAP